MEQLEKKPLIKIITRAAMIQYYRDNVDEMERIFMGFEFDLSECNKRFEQSSGISPEYADFPILAALDSMNLLPIPFEYNEEVHWLELLSTDSIEFLSTVFFLGHPVQFDWVYSFEKAYKILTPSLEIIDRTMNMESVADEQILPEQPVLIKLPEGANLKLVNNISSAPQIIREIYLKVHHLELLLDEEHHLPDEAADTKYKYWFYLLVAFENPTDSSDQFESGTAGIFDILLDRDSSPYVQISRMLYDRHESLEVEKSLRDVIKLAINLSNELSTSVAVDI